MERKQTLWLLIPLLLVLFPSASAHANVPAGPDVDDRKNNTAALIQLRALAEEGHVNSQYDLGVLYTKGQGVTQDPQKALHWFHLASEQGHSLAQYNLGVMYHEGRSVPKDLQVASHLYRLAADQGLAAAQSNLGVLYFLGQGVPQDDQKAVYWYRLAAEQGDSVAQVMLGNMFRLGRGVEENEQEAVHWWRKAAETGNEFAQYQLGLSYAVSSEMGTDPDKIEAYKWFVISASQGNKDAESLMTSMGEEMTEAQIAEARQLAQSWMANHQK